MDVFSLNIKIKEIPMNELIAKLHHAINWAANLRSSTSSRWPVHLTAGNVTDERHIWTGPPEKTILVIDHHGQTCAFQREWDPRKHYRQRQSTLIASVFHIDGLITVVLAPEYTHLLKEI